MKNILALNWRSKLKEMENVSFLDDIIFIRMRLSIRISVLLKWI